ncbi:MAG: 5-formyltetrahydrofolate cyclo-ligase [Spirochaetaceae bacterium]
MNIKNTLRKEIEQKLSTLDKDTRESHSYKIAQNIINTKEWQESTKIYLFLNFKTEVETDIIIDLAIAYDKKVYAPTINGTSMDFYRIDNISRDELIKNSYGILEPSKDLKVSTPTNKSLMLVPGLGFSIKGNRLGRGAGYYDKYLAVHKDVIKIGITYSLQLSTNIPTEDWDIEMDFVITEDNTYTIGADSGN